MFWAQLMLLACWLLTLFATIYYAHEEKQGCAHCVVAAVVFALTYFAGAFSEVIAWLK